MSSLKLIVVEDKDVECPPFFQFLHGWGKKMKMGMGFSEEVREWRLPGLLYVDHLILCGE